MIKLYMYYKERILMHNRSALVALRSDVRHQSCSSFSWGLLNVNGLQLGSLLIKFLYIELAKLTKYGNETYMLDLLNGSHKSVEANGQVEKSEMNAHVEQAF